MDGEAISKNKAAFHNTHQNGHADFKAFLFKHGPWVTLAAGTLWFMGFYIILPDNLDRREFHKALVQTNAEFARSMATMVAIQESQAATLRQIMVTIQQPQADALREIAEGQKEQNRLQKQLLDATERGAGRETKRP